MEDNTWDLWDQAMKEYNQANPAPSKKSTCEHKRTFYWQGWEACSECGLCIHKVFSQDPYSNVAGYIIKPKEDNFPKIKETMTDVIKSVTLEKVMLNGVLCWDVPLENGLPFELFDHMKDLCMKYLDLEIKKEVRCHTRSLCAAILWEKVKSLYPDAMTLTEFSKKVGVSVPTIIKINLN